MQRCVFSFVIRYLFDKVNGCDSLFIMSVTNFSLCSCPEGDLSLHVTKYCRCCIKLTLPIQSEPN